MSWPVPRVDNSPYLPCTCFSGRVVHRDGNPGFFVPFPARPTCLHVKIAQLATISPCRAMLGPGSFSLPRACQKPRSDGHDYPRSRVPRASLPRANCRRRRHR